jgi:hypothetical protein
MAFLPRLRFSNKEAFQLRAHRWQRDNFVKPVAHALFQGWRLSKRPTAALCRIVLGKYSRGGVHSVSRPRPHLRCNRRVYVGPPELVAQMKGSRTAPYLATHLGVTFAASTME